MKKILFISLILISIILLTSCSEVAIPETGDYECEFDTKSKTASIVGYKGDKNATELEIPSKFGEFTVTEIGHKVFSEFYDATKITIPDSVKIIGTSAFELCVSLEEIILPASLEKIGNTAFSECRELSAIYIPSNVSEIGICVFTGCSSLEEIIVDEHNENYVSDNSGVLLNKDKTQLIQYPLGSERSDYTLPDSVVSISDYAFEKANYLENVTFSSNLETLGNYALQGSSIKEAIFKNNLKQIGNYAFNESDLESITLGDSLETIGNSAFSWCLSLKEIKIPSSVKTIGQSAFYMCAALENIIVEDENASYSSQDGVLFNKDKTELIQYPAGNKSKKYNILDTVKEVKASAFYSSMFIEKIIIPKSVEKIESQAFAMCPNMSEIVFIGPRPDNIAEDAFG